MPIITHDRPDPRFYVNIIQGDDGNWSSDQMPLDDGSFPIYGATFPTPGLRSLVKQNINDYTSIYIYTHAPDYAQRDALFTLQTQTSGQAWQDATDMWNWITDVTNYNATLKTAVNTMTFDQLVVYVIPPTWPAPPPSIA